MSDSLLVTNGASAVDAMRQAGIGSPILSWDDVLHDGPVPGGLAAEALAEVRAAYLVQAGAGTDTLARFRHRDTALASASQVTVWFEHDLYDQLQLIQVLARVDPSVPISMVPEDVFITHRPTHDLPRRLALQHPVAPDLRELAEEAWLAFTSPDPRSLEALLIAGALEGLPHLPSAVRRWLETFPDSSGVSRTERAVLHLLRDGPISGKDLFLATQAMEEAAFRGDWSFGNLLAGLRGMIKPSEGDFWISSTWSLTPAGDDVLERRRDRVALMGIDAWRGGVHLTSTNDWRWTGGLLERRR